MCVIPIVGIVVLIIDKKWREHGTSTQLFVIPIHHNMLSHIFATEVNELRINACAYQLHLTCRVYGILDYLHPLLKKKTIVTYIVKNHGTVFWSILVIYIGKAKI